MLNYLISTLSDSEEHEQYTSPSLGEFAGVWEQVLKLSVLIYKASGLSMVCSALQLLK